MVTDLQPGVLVKQGPSGEAHYEYTHFLNPDLVGFRMWVRVYPKAKKVVVDVESTLTPKSKPTVGYLVAKWVVEDGVKVIPEFTQVLEEWASFGVARSMYDALLTHGSKVLHATHFVKGEAHTPELRGMALKFGLTYEPLGKAETVSLEELAKSMRPTSMSLDVVGVPAVNGRSTVQAQYGSGDPRLYDYSHLLPEELQSRYKLQAWTPTHPAPARRISDPKSTKVAVVRMDGTPAVEIEGNHLPDGSVEPHIAPLRERKAAGATVYALQALLAHARNHHGLKAITVPIHTPAAANLIRKYLGLLGAQYQGKPVENVYARIAREDNAYMEPYLTEPSHLMSGFDVALKSEDLGKMALAYEIGRHGRQPVTVYRIENKRGEGPYHGGGDSNYSTAEYFNRADAGLSPAPKVTVPGPKGPVKEIPVEEGYDSGLWRDQDADEDQLSFARVSRMDPRWHGSKPLFAFAKPEDAVEWFGPDTIRKMAKAGYHVRAVPAAKVWLSSSGRQVIFHPHDTYKAGDQSRVIDMEPVLTEYAATRKPINARSGVDTLMGGPPVKTGWKPAKPKDIREPFRRSEREQAVWLNDLRKDIADFKQVGEALGSNEGGTFVHPQTGERYYFKFQPTNDHSRNEILAHKLYQAAGVPALDMRPLKLGDGRIGTGTKWVKSTPLNLADPNHMAQARKLFALHAWLGNWDHHVRGNMAMRDGKIGAMDLGGALLFRAQGEPKPNFGTSVDEWDTLREHDYKGFFDNMTPQELQESAKIVAGVNDATIDDLVQKHGPGNPKQKAQLAGILKARRQDVLRRANG